MPERRKKKKLKSTLHHAAKKSRKAAPKRALKASPKKTRTPLQASEASKARPEPPQTLSVYDSAGKSVETVALDPIFREGTLNMDVIYQAVLKYRAGEREGTASTKDRGHVRGGGKKPWKQKGTGQARHGSRRSPIWRGGGTTFGPMPRDYSYTLPLTIKRTAVAELVKDKVLNGKLYLLKQLELKSPKTKTVAELLDTFKLERPLIVVDQKGRNLLLASRNLSHVTVKTALELNALDLVASKECLMTKAAYAGLVNRLKSLKD